VVSVKCFRCIVFGIDDQRKHGHFQTLGALYRVPKQRAPKLLAAMPLINSEATEPRDGNGRIAGKPLQQRWGKSVNATPAAASVKKPAIIPVADSAAT
jgi:hypothetical protein